MTKAIPVSPPNPKDMISPSCRVIASSIAVSSVGVISIPQEVFTEAETEIDSSPVDHGEKIIKHYLLPGIWLMPILMEKR